MTLFLCGDVMTGRGIDQILPHPNQAELREPYVKNAREYVTLAEEKSGKIRAPVPYPYIWGAALREFERFKPDVRIINLETSITKSEDWIPKGINYRMHPDNIACLTVPKTDCCVLGNNHVLDFGVSGLVETLEVLSKTGIAHPGAGINRSEAQAPATIIVSGKGRVLVFSFGLESSGIPQNWAATDTRPGVNFLGDLSGSSVDHVKELVKRFKQTGDIVVASIHWGPNWGYELDRDEVDFAHGLIERAGVDVVHGHSSHHPKGIERYQDHLIIYGCGDFIDDYEGITGFEEYRGDLGLMYFVTLSPSTGKLVSLQMMPTQMRQFRIRSASREDALWLKEVLNREGRQFGTWVSMETNGALSLHWRTERAYVAS